MVRYLLALLVVVPTFAFGQGRLLRVERVKGRAWLVFSGRRQRLRAGMLNFGVTIECERGAKAEIAMPDGSRVILLPPPAGCRRTRATFGRTRRGKDAVFLEEGAAKALFATTRFCVVGKKFSVEPFAKKLSRKKFLAEGLVRLVRKKKQWWWSVFAIANGLKVLLSDSGAEITVPENEVALVRFLEKEKRWQIRADEANEKNITLRARDGTKTDLAANQSVEISADRKDKKKYGLVVRPPAPPGVPGLRLKREPHLRLPVDTPYEDPGELQEAPDVTPAQPEEG